MAALDDIENDKAYKYAYELISEGKTAEQVRDELIAQGLESKRAAFIANDVSKSYPELELKTGKKNMAWGAALCTAAIITTVINNNSQKSHTVYLIAWGFIVTGAIFFIKGLYKRVHSGANK
jgi:hypothetical protein